MPLQNGAYLALSRKFCRQVNIVKIFSLVRQTRNTRAGPDAMAKVVGTVGGSKAICAFSRAARECSSGLIPACSRLSLAGTLRCSLGAPDALAAY
jgi:hypothetical protein